MEFQFGTRRLFVWTTIVVPMATQFARNFRRGLHASDLFKHVPMPIELEWLRQSIELVSSKHQTEASFIIEGAVISDRS